VAQQAREPPSCRGLGPEERVEPVVAVAKIEIQDCTAGDWVRVLIDGDVFHEGHDVPSFKWAELLAKVGCEVTETEHKPSYFTGCEADDEEE
jgi:hypothetical protein